jgi:hypothetical protein
VTEDAIRSEIVGLRAELAKGLTDVRADVAGARAAAAEGHQRLRDDLSARLSDAVEAKVRIRILEDNQKALIESRRYMWAQVVAASGVVATLVGLLIAYKVHP